MIELLKKHQKKIDFTLLFIPALTLSVWVWDGGSDLMKISLYGSNYSISVGSYFLELIGWSMPFLLWRIIATYWLK